MERELKSSQGGKLPRTLIICLIFYFVNTLREVLEIFTTLQDSIWRTGGIFVVDYCWIVHPNKNVARTLSIFRISAERFKLILM